MDGFQLHHFAFGDDRRSAGQNVEHRQIVGLHHQLEGAAEEEIAHQHGGLVAPHQVGGDLAAAQGAFVHHIVMQQGGGVDELHRRGQPHMMVAGIAAGLGRRQGEHGAQPLAAGIDQMLGQIGDQRHAGSHAGMDQLVGGGHVGGRPGHAAAPPGKCRCRFLRQNLERPLTHPFAPEYRTPVRPPSGRQCSNGDRKARFGYKGAMRAVLKTTDPVVLNFAANLLSQEGIESVIFDTHASVMDGSMGFLPRRLMVLDEDFAQADKLLRAAVPEAM